MILHLSSDLMLVGKVSSWANSGNRDYRNAASLKKFGELLSAGAELRVVIDLQFRGLDIAAIANEVRQANTKSTLSGYAQHVMTDLIQSAEMAEFDSVMTRGQFDRQFASVMTG